MINRMLIVHGLRTTQELEALGLPMAQRYESSQIVVLIGSDGRGLVVKGAKETTVVQFCDADPTIARCMRAVNRVKEAAESARDEGEATRTVGMFLYYWPVSLQSVDVVMAAIEQGNVVAVEKAADAFIKTDFGSNLAALGTLQSDDHSDDAAGHATDGATDPVFGSS